MRYCWCLLILVAGCALQPAPRGDLAPPLNLSVSTLKAEYEADPRAADRKYRGAKVQLLGNVENVYFEGLKGRRVVIRQPNEPRGSYSVDCHFDPFWDSLLSELQPGDCFDNHHQLIGTLHREGDQLVLRECSVKITRE